ncbi:MAG: TonB-dependent receptor [Candidatus Brevundimonas colombiensis]|uniref:TonB-dependent receptor n=1 Tax=Candidatus Brevundimonas colombiensis TaxID=3121376 RepID=A0AAJ6BLX4_9CAUL|nr:TonB-dependent receptor [Brevundimonas sp.]WEK40056.1 MAG: TonB-dependent receptor [Brevundimonas sp.]
MRAAFARQSLKTAMLATTALFSVATGAAAQQADPQPTEVDEIVVVGSQIRGAKVTAALPVTVIGEEQILATAASSGDELLRSIPQMGDVTFNSAYLPASSNSARGDTGSVNLRNLGIGNTLVLLNGRRVVGHPTSQANEHLVPVLTYNTNAIPVSGLKRLEVLRDGAAAIYGADAVAGVVNTVLRDDMTDWTVSSQYGGAEGTGLREFNFSLYGGQDIAEGRGNVSAFFNYDHRSELTTLEQPYTASDDKRPLFAGTGFENNSVLNGLSSLTPWGYFRPTDGRVLIGGAQRQAFTVQPNSLNGCIQQLGGGLCLKDTVNVDASLLADTAKEDLTVIPSIDRYNLFLTGRYKINDAVEAFGEIGGYYAKSHARQAPINTLSSIAMTIPTTNAYNPVGEDVFLSGYRFNDMGPINVDVTNEQYRILGGLRGDWRGWRWESALVWSEASAKDVSDNISTTRLAEWAAKSTPDAYNFFNGGDPASPRFGDSTPSNQAALDAIRVDMVRKTKTELGLWDFKISRPDVFQLPGGPVGMAAGIEFRTESQLDDRDSRIDGTIRYTDKSGAAYSDLINSSENPDTYGERDVFSAYLEIAAPLVSPEMNIPLVHNLEVQLAGRFENYSDFGDVAKPKIAAAWDIVDGFRIRASWAQGFRAPNLEQINATVITRSNSSNDYIYCEALIRRGAAATGMANMNECGASYRPTANTATDLANINTTHVRKLTAERRSGNPNLQPEESETTSVGVVIQPRFLPEQLGNFTVTADLWKVEQTGMVGLFRGQNALILDYLLRKSGGSNPNVVRADPTAADQAIFAGTGLTPVGEVQYITDAYSNQQPQTVEGLDLGVMWNLRGTRVGDFSLNLNVSHLIKYYLEMSPGMQELQAARDAGSIPASITLGGRMGDLIDDQGRPEWKWSLSGSWRYQNLTVGAFSQYISSMYDSSLVNSTGDYWTIDSTLTANLYAEYQFDQGVLSDTSIRLGVRNLSDEQPPLSAAGYLGTVYQPYGRYWYVSFRKTF